MTHRWTIRDGDPRAREELSRALSVSGLVAAVLVARGITGLEPARTFLSPTLAELPDPRSIPGMNVGARRLAEAVMNGDFLWVYADYDVDGVTSAALLTEFLAQCGTRSRVHLPRRDREGYGLHASALEEIAAQGGQLVVTADCGIAAVDAARRAVELGLELIITDHHTPGDELPRAAAVVNPKLPGSTYPEPAPAGVGVAWNLAAATRRELRGGSGRRPAHTAASADEGTNKREGGNSERTGDHVSRKTSVEPCANHTTEQIPCAT